MDLPDLPNFPARLRFFLRLRSPFRQPSSQKIVSETRSLQCERKGFWTISLTVFMVAYIVTILFRVVNA